MFLGWDIQAFRGHGAAGVPLLLYELVAVEDIMARIKRYIHRVTMATPIAGIGTAFATAKAATVDLEMFPPDSAYLGRLHSVIYHVSAISSAATLTMRLCTDTAGDVMLVTDTDGTIYPGVTTATKGSISYKLDYDVGLDTGDQVHLFHKVNTGSLTIDKIEICWEE